MKLVTLINPGPRKAKKQTKNGGASMLRRNKKGQFVKARRAVKRNPVKKVTRADAKRKIASATYKAPTKRLGRLTPAVRKYAGIGSARRSRPVVYQLPNGTLFTRKGAMTKNVRVNPSSKRRTYRRNPSIKSIFNKDLLIKAGSMLAGYFAGRMVNRQALLQLSKISAIAPYAKYSGVASVIVGTLVAGKVRRPELKTAAIGLAASGVESVLRAAMPETMAKLGASIPWEGELVNLGALVPASSLNGSIPWEGGLVPASEWDDELDLF